ncbi:MAG: hypothetical protein ABR607_08675 [Pyrinomonadaceae bacterium]
MRLTPLLICLSLLFQPIAIFAQSRGIATVTIDIAHPVNRFKPSHALGAAIDGHEKGTNDLQLTGPNINAMLSAGLKSLTYRLRTELGGDVWHWNPNGAWSDAQEREGYWVSDSRPSEPISLSYGYRLPRRGNTIDQAANNDYSRIDDADTSSFWKSNPYLDRQFTGEDNKLHPQWIVIEFEKPVLINALRFVWGEPFAKAYRVQYGNFDDVSNIALSPPGAWQNFPLGKIPVGSGGLLSRDGKVPLRIFNAPIKLRWLRILMTESSGTSQNSSSDIRDRVGFALNEIYAGYQDSRGKFHDAIRHGADRRKQTIIHVSSTDPWHRASNQDNEIEQVGLDRIYQTGLTNNLPMLVPTGLLYDTPENAANEIRYLRARGYRFDQVELGEEPDGQYVTPEDFGALYVQFAEAIHRVDPSLKLGGPSFQEVLPDISGHAYRIDNSQWIRRFLDYLKGRGRLKDYSFFSFEWYPFDDVCAPVAPQLARAPRMLEDALKEMQRRGVSRNIPWIISEYGYSAFAGRAEISIEGALLNADIVGKFLALGGDQVFLFGYTPAEMLREIPCSTGNNMLFSMDENGNIQHRFATYFGARLLAEQWLKPGDETHELYAAKSDVHDPSGNELVTAYAVHRPDGLWSVLLINKDPKRAFQADILFRDGKSESARNFAGNVEIYQYSGKQYELGGPRNDPYPVKTNEPEHRRIDLLEKEPRLSLLPYSLTIVRGNLAYF